ncbi:putative ribonuclease H [[Candida] jaroonii]|uniref:Ribonuclease H n=1 Tax=[Candida] jaroonii TaxID=467808 RepID=A0ACA9Y644_9ASCO|nr:putative ribonuclease H [[Candida] jaroonii]
MPFYAVAKGRKVGIFHHWDQVKPLVNGFSGPKFKKFNTEAEANKFVEENSGEQTPREIHNTKRPRFESNLNLIYQEADLIPKKSIAPSLAGLKISRSADKYDIEEELPPEIYTDGAARGNGTMHTISGYGVFIGRNHTNISVSWRNCKKYAGSAYPTNQTLELLAIRHGLKLIESKKPPIIVIKTDSQFGINCLTKWSEGWKKKGWKKTDGKQVVHKDILIDCLDIMDRIKYSTNLQFEHIRGHQGHYGNEMADLLANLACDSP